MKLLNYGLLTALISITLTGCAQTKYSWNGYDQKLYDHYKNPAEYAEFVDSLKEIIQDGEQDNKVPPGIYAEYGYVMYEKGRLDEAILYFKKEQNKWPESLTLMSKVIGNAQKKQTQIKSKNDVTVMKPVQATEVVK